MKSKIQQYNILSLKSSLLKAKSYKIRISYEEALSSGMVVSISNSQMTETIFSIRGLKNVKQEILDASEKKRTAKKSASKDDYIKASLALQKILHIDEIVSITFEHNAHYKKACSNGVEINGIRYVRFLAGAGQLRRKTVLFINENIKEEVDRRFYNGIDLSQKINMSKFGAYFGLYSSSGKKVSTPRYIVVKDFKFIKRERVDFVVDDNTVEERDMDLEVNSFDGMGLISTEMAKVWSSELEMDRDGIQFIVRAPFTKGLLVSFPFHLFAYEKGVDKITDIYGNTHNISEVDVILTESQFKMASHYSSVEEHRENSKDNGLSWFVTRTNPERDKDSFWTSYQYIQVLKDSINIERLTEDTVSFFENVSLDTRESAILYLCGENSSWEFDIDRMDNYYLKLLMLSKDSIKDPYVYKHLGSSLSKKIRESYSGKLLVRGNYSFLIIDPLALCEHALSIPVVGALKSEEYYSEYWNSKEVSRVASGRSPLTWRSELVNMRFERNQYVKKWFSHLYSGIIISAFGNDVMKFADGDADGDIIFTTSNPEIVDGSYGGLPVTYEKKPTPKTNFSIEDLPFFETKSFGTKIGLITNYSTTMMAMLPEYGEQSPEGVEIIKRLKICRKKQSEQIDLTKGLIVDGLPAWNKRVKDNDIHNSIIINKRPFFMKYLYPYKQREYETHVKNYDIYCWMKWGFGIEKLRSLEFKTEEQSQVCRKFEKNSPLIIGSKSIMERVSRYMVQKVSDLKKRRKESLFDYSQYLSENACEDSDIISKLESLLKVYNKAKKSIYVQDGFESKEVVFEDIKNKVFEISYDYETLTDNAVILCYKYGKNKNFAHEIFGDGIVANLKKKNRLMLVPFENPSGDFEHLYRKYSFEERPL